MARGRKPLEHKPPERQPSYPANVVDMASAMQAEREVGTRRKVYADREAASEHKRGELSEMIGRLSHQLKTADSLPRIYPHDTETVKQRIFEYLEACTASATIPSVEGAARSLRISRQALYTWIDKPSPGCQETSAFLEQFRDLCSEILQQGALSRTISEVFAIFVSKARFGMIETLRLEAASPSPIGDVEDSQVLLNRYKDALPDVTGLDEYGGE